MLAISGDGLVRNLLVVLIIAICIGAIYFVGRWFLTKLGKPMVLTVWDGFFLLVGLIIAVNFLMGLIGHSFIPL